jgi:hypothetical protein
MEKRLSLRATIRANTIDLSFVIAEKVAIVGRVKNLPTFYCMSSKIIN